VSLELAKKLKEAGYPQDSYWFHTGKILLERERVVSCIENGSDESKFYAAPSVGELLAQLPKIVKDCRLEIHKYGLEEYVVKYSLIFYSCDDPQLVMFEGLLADACGEMWIWLKKEGLL